MKKGADEGPCRGYAHKNVVMGHLIERRPEGRQGAVFPASKAPAAADLLPTIRRTPTAETHVMTDEAGQYAHLNKHFTEHDFVRHSKG